MLGPSAGHFSAAGVALATLWYRHGEQPQHRRLVDYGDLTLLTPLLLCTVAALLLPLRLYAAVALLMPLSAAAMLLSLRTTLPRGCHCKPRRAAAALPCALVLVGLVAGVARPDVAPLVFAACALASCSARVSGCSHSTRRDLCLALVCAVVLAASSDTAVAVLFACTVMTPALAVAYSMTTTTVTDASHNDINSLL